MALSSSLPHLCWCCRWACISVCGRSQSPDPHYYWLPPCQWTGGTQASTQLMAGHSTQAGISTGKISIHCSESTTEHGAQVLSENLSSSRCLKFRVLGWVHGKLNNGLIYTGFIDVWIDMCWMVRNIVTRHHYWVNVRLLRMVQLQHQVVAVTTEFQITSVIAAYQISGCPLQYTALLLSVSSMYWEYTCRIGARNQNSSPWGLEVWCKWTFFLSFTQQCCPQLLFGCRSEQSLVVWR